MGHRVANKKEISAAIRSYSEVIGELVWASNFTHSEFEILFSHVATPTEFLTGRAIWHTCASDSSRLKMLEAATKVSGRLSKRMRENILWAVEMSLKLAESRNDAVHSLTFVRRESPVKVTISQHGTKPKRYAKLESKSDLKKYYRLVGADLWRLGAYIRELWPRVAGFDALLPLSRRPRLASIPRNNQKKLHPLPRLKSPASHP
jgi:hypothetical protein